MVDYLVHLLDETMVDQRVEKKAVYLVETMDALLDETMADYWVEKRAGL